MAKRHPGAAERQPGRRVALLNQCTLMKRRDEGIAADTQRQQRQRGEKMQQQDRQSTVERLPQNSERIGHGMDSRMFRTSGS
jgi:hypothetical protein